MSERSPAPTSVSTNDQREPFSIVCHDGWTLRGEVVVGAPPVAVAVIGHAMMVDRRTLDRPRGRGLVSLLAARGIACVSADLRGHGKSGPRADEGGDWSYDDLVDGDVPALVAWARARFVGLPVVCVGHSLFGCLALAHLARHPDSPVAALVLLACNVSHPHWGRRPLSRWSKGALIELMGLATRVAGHLPVRRLRLGTDDESRGYVRDFVRFWRVGDWQARDGFSYFAALPSLRTPTLALVGAADRLMCPPEDARELVNQLPNGRFEIVGRQSGLPFDPDHMGLVLDPRAGGAWNRVADFILEQTRGSSKTPA